MKRSQIEASVSISSTGAKKIGEALIQEAIAVSRAERCSLVQLTTDKQRVDAHRFYHRLGFVSSHEGMKLNL